MRRKSIKKETTMDDNGNFRQNETGKKAKISRMEEEFAEVNREVQRLCRKIRDSYHQEKCNELEDLDRLHSPKQHKDIQNCEGKAERKRRDR